MNQKNWWKSFLNLGYQDEDIRKYEEELAKGNLPLLSVYSVMGIAVLLLYLIVQCIHDGFCIAEDLPILAVSFLLGILSIASKTEAEYGRKHCGRIRCMIFVFSLLWYLTSIYYGIVLHPAEVSLTVCIALFAIPCLFDVIPVDALLLHGIVYLLLVISELTFASPEVCVKDLAYFAIILLMGLFVGWNKASSKIAQLRYVDIYQAIGTIYERAIYVNLRENSFRTIQGEKEFRAMADQCETPEELFRTYAENCVDREFRKRYLDFMNFRSVDVRMKFAKTLEFEYRNQSGIWQKIRLIAQKRSEEDGRIGAIVIVARNIHSQKLKELDYENLLNRTADDAIRENEVKTSYLRRISHDIRTTINGICGMVAISEHYSEDMEKQQEAREKILTSARYLLDLMNGVLDIKDLETDMQKLQENPGQRPARGETPASIRGSKILLVEDDEINMEIADFMLRDGGAEVVKAWDGQAAVECFRKSAPHEFDVILMDLMMPRMNGIEATRAIRAMKREDASSVPIIAMTANAFLDDRESCMRAGMNDHVSKPVNTDRLLAIIAGYLQKK